MSRIHAGVVFPDVDTPKLAAVQARVWTDGGTDWLGHERKVYSWSGGDVDGLSMSGTPLCEMSVGRGARYVYVCFEYAMDDWKC